MEFIYNDGGRQAAGYKGQASDCVCRSIAIVTGLPYQEVYDAINVVSKNGNSARSGFHTSAKWFKAFMVLLGFEWVPTMGIGTGCKAHLKTEELPHGRLVVSVSQHYTAVIEGNVYDTSDPMRNGKRCVYGYWKYNGKALPSPLLMHRTGKSIELLKQDNHGKRNGK